jgi:O-antigen ligase
MYFFGGVGLIACGAGFFFILRRSGEALRRRSLAAALAGCAVSALAALGQRAGLAPGETSGFWKLTGRLSGGAIDPNALGMLCAMALVAAVALLLSPPRGRAWPLALAAASAAGLALSGSRSAILVVAVGIVALGLAPGLPGRLRLALAGGCVAAVLAAAALLSSASAGNVSARLRQFVDPSLPIDYRVSARPLLWQSALRLFERHPVEGAGLGAFSWQLPNLLAERGLALPIRDNPGNAYLQALAETGAIGFLLTLALALILAREGRAALAAWKEAPWAAGAGAAVIGFLVALALGSHWFAPDIALLFFLLAAVAARAAVLAPARGMARARGLLIAAYAAAAAVALAATLSPGEAFRYRQSMGFHGKEIGPGGPFYWTQRRFAIRLSPGETMRLGLAHFTPEGKGVELTAESGGRVLYRRKLEPGEAVSLRLSSGAGAGLIRFALSRAFVPKRLGLSSDRRELGLVAVFPPKS